MSKESLAKLREQVQKMGSGGVKKDHEGYWRPTTDNLGNGSAVIRFLPGLEEDPFVKVCNHAAKNQRTGKWFIKDCPRTIDLACPVCDLLSKNVEFKQKTYFHSNILVVSDRAASYNEGQVCLFKFGNRIMDKINDALSPQFADIEALNPFDELEGVDFRLVETRQGGYPNFDKSEFEKKPSALVDMSVLTKRRSLAALIAADKFESYEGLKDALEKMLKG